MNWFDDDSQPYEAFQKVEYTGSPDADEWSHELLGGAAAYEACKAYLDHCEGVGEPESRDQAKELLDGLVGACIDRQFEIHGLEQIDREEAKKYGRRLVEDKLSENGSQNGKW